MRPDGLDSRRLVSRVQGRPALERRLRGLLIAVHRFGRARATGHADLAWCARAIDALTALLVTETRPSAGWQPRQSRSAVADLD